MRILEGACPDCGGDIYIDYKHGKLWKCIKCSRIFKPKAMKVVAKLGRERIIKGEKNEGP